MWVVGSRDSSVGVVTRQRVGRSGDRIVAGGKDFSLLQKVQRSTPPLCKRSRCSFPGVKRPGPDVYCSPLSNAEIKSEWRDKE